MTPFDNTQDKSSWMSDLENKVKRMTTPGAQNYSLLYHGLIAAADFEKNKREKMAQEESAYDKAYADTLKAQEIARMKSGPIEAGSEAIKALVGETGAGIAKTGKFKDIYGAGSLLPASWMANKLDPSKIASKVSGLQDRTSNVTGTFGYDDKSSNLAGAVGFGMHRFYPTYSFERSNFNPSAVQKTGLGRYATIK